MLPTVDVTYASFSKVGENIKFEITICIRQNSNVNMSRKHEVNSN